MELNSFVENVRKMKTSDTEKLKFVYEFVRDEILFDFLPEIDDISAEEIYKRRRGQCNNKSILFFEILKRLEYKVVVHFSTIDKNIHRGFFPAPLLFFTPNEIGHSWIEVELNDKKIILDGFINDTSLFNGSLKVNKSKGWDIGHSVALGSCGASADFSLTNNSYVQMEGVIRDLGTTTDPISWLSSSKNPNKVSVLKRLLYRLFLPLIRMRVERVRSLSPIN